MPWQSKTLMQMKEEFVLLACQEGQNLSALCQRYQISRKTAYKWLKRYETEGLAGLSERSRKPKHSPLVSCAHTEHAILEVRDQHPAWGARKIKAYLKHVALPSVSTITEILRRHGRLNPQESQKHTAWKRFEHEHPNDLWQMDFKGHFELLDQKRCYPLTILDDHSRFALGLQACANEQYETVKPKLIQVFRQYGIPIRMTMDNGNPWGGTQGVKSHSVFTLWLYRLGIRVSHSRPFHPQTQGKDERFHRTLKAELLQGLPLKDLPTCQQHFDQWRQLYNCQRPHQALELAVPASRYQISCRPYPQVLPNPEYGLDDEVRRVRSRGTIKFKGQEHYVGKAFIGEDVAIRAPQQQQEEENRFTVYYFNQPIGHIDFTEV